MLRYLTRIGPYVYPNRGSFQETTDRTLLVAETSKPGGGRFSAGSRIPVRRFVAKGELIVPGGATAWGEVLKQLAEEFEYAHRPLDPTRNPLEPAHHTIWVQEDTGDTSASRCLDVSVKSLQIGDYTRPLVKVPWSVEFETGESPFKYNPIASEIALTLDGSSTLVQTGGTCWALPLITLIVTRTGAGSVTVINDTNGQRCTITVSAAGTYRIDSAANTVTYADGSDAYGDFDDDLLQLEGGASGGINFLRLLVTGGVTVTSAHLSWQDRWF